METQINPNDLTGMEAVSASFAHAPVDHSVNPFASVLDRADMRMQRIHTKGVAGKVVEAVGTVVKVALPKVGVGDLVEFRRQDGKTLCFGEVVGFQGDLAIVAVLGESMGISAQTQVVPAGAAQGVEVSEELLGRILDGMGRLCDGGPPLSAPGVMTQFTVIHLRH